MRKIIALSILTFFTFQGYSQGSMDALKYSTNEITGSARAMGMGGAFGAVGGDVSSFHLNPAGLGLYRSSEFTITPFLKFNNTKTINSGGITKENKVKGEIQNLGIVAAFHTGYNKGLLNVNVGFALNRTADFNRNIETRGYNLKTSLSDYIAYKTNSTDNWHGVNPDNLHADDAYTNGANWMSILGAGNRPGSGMIREDDNVYDFYQSNMPNALLNSRLKLRERGYVDEYNLSVAGNIDNILYAGLTLGLHDISYTLTSDYREDFHGSNHNLWLGNYLETTGKGWNLKLGVILRPLPYMRFGVAYQTPTFYDMTDYGYADASANSLGGYYDDQTPEFAYDYDFRTPGKLSLSYALIIAPNAIISMDYDYMDYSTMKFKEQDYYGSFDTSNDLIKSDFKGSHTFRFGIEGRISSAVSIRGGWATSSSGVKANINDGIDEVLTAGTLPHYYFNTGTDYYTLGLGYRFQSFFVDLAYVHKVQKGKLYTFSNYYAVQDDPGNYNIELERPPYGLTFDENEAGTNLNFNPPVKLRDFTNNILLTFGVKF